MQKMSTEELEKKLKALRLTTSPDLDARVKEVWTKVDGGAEPSTGHAGVRVWLIRSALAAAVCLVALGFWWLLKGHGFAPSAYAELLEAVNNSEAAEWVHWHTAPQGLEQDHWVAFRPYRHFIKREDRITAFDYGQRRRYIYDVSSRTLTIDPIEKGSERLEKAKNFFEDCMASIEAAQARGARVSISKAQETIDGKTYTVFTRTNKEGTYRSRYIVDPNTQRIIRWEGIPLAGFRDPTGYYKVPRSMEYDYPDTGPEDIYALGVPRDAHIVREASEEVRALKEKVEAARERFAPRYFAIICQGTIFQRKDRESSFNPIWAHVIYKKNGHYRIEEYPTFLSGEANNPEELWRRVPLDDMPALEAWLKARPLRRVLFAAKDADEATMLTVQHDGKLKREAAWVNWGQWTVEEKVWHFHMPMKLMAHDVDGPLRKDGKFGRLAGVEHTSWGSIFRRTVNTFPERRRQYHNPERDYICEEFESIIDAQAPWLEDPDWLQRADGVDRETREYRATRMRRVIDYAKTEQGQWYAKKIHTDRASSRTREPATDVTIIHLDTTRQIPDELLDPDSIDSPETFAPQGTGQREFNKALAIIDSREDWPSTPEEVCKAYWDARNAKDFEEMAILWPGSASWNHQLKDEKPVEYVFGDARLEPQSKRVLVPYASKAHYEKHKTYNLTMRLMNEKSSKGRYYIGSGN